MWPMRISAEAWAVRRSGDFSLFQRSATDKRYDSLSCQYPRDTPEPKERPYKTTGVHSPSDLWEVLNRIAFGHGRAMPFVLLYQRSSWR